MSARDLPDLRPRRAHRYLCRALLAACLWAQAAQARDDEPAPDARSEARTLAAQGSDAFEAGDFATALALFDRAAQIVEAPTISLMQARTLVELGRLVAAAERYTAAQRTAPEDSGNTAFQSAAETAVRELAALKRRIPTLRVKLVGGAAENAVVVIDGRALPPEAATADQLLDPGSHNVLVKTASGSASGQTIRLAEGAREELVFSLEPVARTAAPPAPPQEESRADVHASKPRVAAWVALGAGVAFTGTGAVLGVLALENKAELDRACNPACPSGSEDDIDTFRLQRNLSYVGFALGAVGIGTSVYLFLRNEPGKTSTALALTPSGVTLSGRFQ